MLIFEICALLTSITRLIELAHKPCCVLADCRQPGSYPETGLEEIGRIGTAKSASE